MCKRFTYLACLSCSWSCSLAPFPWFASSAEAGFVPDQLLHQPSEARACRGPQPVSTLWPLCSCKTAFRQRHIYLLYIYRGEALSLTSKESEPYLYSFSRPPCYRNTPQLFNFYTPWLRERLSTLPPMTVSIPQTVAERTQSQAKPVC